MSITSKLVATILVMFIFMISSESWAQKQAVQIDTTYYSSYRNRNEKIIQSISYAIDTSSKTVKEYYRSGALRANQKYVNQKLQGVQSYFYENGLKWKVLKYEKGYLLETAFWSASGMMSAKSSSIISGKSTIRHGKFIEYFSSGKVSRSGAYDSGRMHKKWLEYYESGKKKSIKTYKKGHLNGKSLYWNQSGIVQGKYNYVYDSEKKIGVKHKKQVSYFNNGELRSIENYSFGKKHGIIKTWYPNGKLESEVAYKNGDNFGVNNTYYSSGKPKRIMNYYNVLDSSQKYNRRIYYEGKYAEYYENGNVRVSKNYKKESLDGAERTYSQNGKLKNETNYRKGLKEGKSLSWNPDGVLVFEENYKIYGTSDSLYSLKDGLSANYSNESDTLRYGKYLRGQKVGVWKSWDKEGNLASIEEYCDGLICGVKKQWDKGALTFIGSFKVYEKLGKRNAYAIGKHESFRNGIKEKIRYYNDSGLVLSSSNYYSSGNLKQIFLHCLPAKEGYNSVTTGRMYTFYENGKLRSIETSVNSRNAGLSRYYFMNGKPRTYKFWPVNFKDDKGLVLDWDTEGGLIAFKEYSDYDTSKTLRDLSLASKIHQHLIKTRRDAAFYDSFTFKSPLVEVYHDNRVESRILLAGKEGKGSAEMFYSNGAPFLKIELTDGIADGDYQLKSANTYPIENGAYQNGRKVGVWKYYNSKDTLRQELEFFDRTQRYYKQTDYYKSGQKKSVITYKNGRQMGEALGYFLNGKPQWENHFKNGSLDSISKRFNEDGQIRSSTEYKMGRKNGKEEYWSAGGKSQYFYKNGKLDGLCIAYWNTGKLRSKGYYTNGLKDSVWLIYDDSGELKSQYFYKKGQLVSNSQKTTCDCIEKVPKKMMFVPLLRHLTSLEKVNKFRFNFHDSICDFYNSLFYKNLQFSNSGTSHFASLTLISFQEAFIHLPNKNGLKLIMNPCFRQPGTYSEIPIRVNSQSDDKEALNISLNPSKLALEFNPFLLRQWDTALAKPRSIYLDRRSVFLGSKLFFDASQVTYNNSGKLGLRNVGNPCFTPSEIGKSGVRLKIHKASINLNPDRENFGNEYSQHSIDFYKYVKKIRKKKSSYGEVVFDAVKGDSTSLILPQSIFGGAAKDTLLRATSLLLISSNSVFGSFKMQAELDEGLSYKIKIGNVYKVVPANEISDNLQKLGFSFSEIKYNNKTKELIIHFNYYL